MSALGAPRRGRSWRAGGAGRGERRPPSQAAPRGSAPADSAPRRREASAARPQMSLPLRLPCCYPARRRRGAPWLARICAPVTPPPSLRPRPGARPRARRRRCGGLLRGGGPGPGRQLQAARPLGRRRGARGALATPPETRLPPGSRGPHVLACRPVPRVPGSRPATPQGPRRAQDYQPGASGTPPLADASWS